MRRGPASAIPAALKAAKLKGKRVIKKAHPKVRNELVRTNQASFAMLRAQKKLMLESKHVQEPIRIQILRSSWMD